MQHTATIRRAATIALLRDGEQGPEVLLLRRNARHVFAASAWVYPGGALEDTDEKPAVQRHYETQRRQSEVMPDWLTHCVAATRECFEEVGVLVGHRMNPSLQGAALARARDQLNAGHIDWPCLVERMQLHFAPEALVYFAHWTTPPGLPRRFNTRFFAARMPERQTACVDGSELTQDCWLRPADALQRHADGHMNLLHPTRATLQQLAGHRNVATILTQLAKHPAKGDRA